MLVSTGPKVQIINEKKGRSLRRGEKEAQLETQKLHHLKIEYEKYAKTKRVM